MHKALGLEQRRSLPEDQPIMDGVRVHQINSARVATIGCGDIVELGQWAADKDTMPGVCRDWQAIPIIIIDDYYE